MKKTVAWLMILVMTLALVGCASKPAPAATEKTEPAPAAAPVAEAPKSDFPNKSIEITVPYAAGGSIDLCGRILAKYLEPVLGVSVVVQNREGGGGATGTTFAAQAKPDGYTMICNVPTHMYQKKTAEGVTYDRSSFRSVAQVADDPICIAALSNKYPTLADLVADAKARPGEVTVAITSNWGAYDLGRLMIESATGVKFRRVGYEGGANGVKALIAGEVDCLLTFPGDILAYVESGDAAILAVGLGERNDALKDVPTFTELGYDVVFGNLRFFSVPAGTPDDVVATIEAAIEKVYADPAFQEEMRNSGFPVLVYRGADALDEALTTLEGVLLPLVDDMLVEKNAASK